VLQVYTASPVIYSSNLRTKPGRLVHESDNLVGEGDGEGYLCARRKRMNHVDFGDVHCGVGGLIARESLPFTQLIVRMHRCTFFLDSKRSRDQETGPADGHLSSPPTSRHKGFTARPSMNIGVIRQRLSRATLILIMVYRQTVYLGSKEMV